MSNRKAFLDMLAWSEGTYGIGDNGYNVLVGSTKKNPVLFGTYTDHPRQRVYLPVWKIYSTAAGRYQILARYYDAYKKQLNLPDFSPASQDAIALQMIRERRALPDIDAGRFEVAVTKCRNIWASLPGAGYNQREHRMADLQNMYQKFGGQVMTA